jgi:hypothetical protein
MRIAALVLLLTAGLQPGPAAVPSPRFTAVDLQRDWGVVYAVRLADVNGDGRLDVVIANETATTHDDPNPKTNYLYINQTTASNDIRFGDAIALDGPGQEAYTRRIIMIDVEGDNDLDLVATSADNAGDGAGNGNVLYRNNNGTFAAAAPLNASAADDTDVANSIGAGDLDGDGDADLVFGTWTRVVGGAAVDAPDRYYINKSTPAGPDFETTGTFGPSGPTANSRSTNVELGDFNNDTRLDAVIVSFNATEDAGDPSRLHVNTGTVDVPFPSTDLGLPIDPPEQARIALLDPATAGLTDLARGVDSADLNGDNRLDLVIVSRAQVALRYLNCPPAGNGCDPLNGFQNDVPSITGQSAPSDPVPVNTPINVNDHLGVLSVQDSDNDYYHDFTAVLPYPPLNSNYTCTDGNGQFSCVGSRVTPAAGFTGDLQVLVRVHDWDWLSNDQVMTLRVGGSGFPPNFTSTPILTATQGTAYTYVVTATDGDGDAVEITEATALPAWLSWSTPGTQEFPPGSANYRRTLVGTPQGAHVGNHAIQLSACGVASCALSATQNFTINVADLNDAPTITSTPVTGVTQGTAYTYNITTADPDAGAIRTVSAPTLPAWLSLTNVNPAAGTARLEGTPTQAHIGTHNVTLRVTDNGTPALSADQTFTITVANTNVAPVITTTSLPAGTVGAVYNASVAATDTDVPPNTLTFSATGLPAGLAINSAGAISGTPTTAGTSPVTVTVSDGLGGSASANLELVVNAAAPANRPPTITPPGPQTATVGVAYSVNVAPNASDPDGDPLTFSATGLPQGITMSPAGVASGSPTTPGTNSVTVTVSDGPGLSASATFQITVAAAPTPPPPPSGGGSGGGGGAFGLGELVSLLFMGLIVGLRRRRLTLA